MDELPYSADYDAARRTLVVTGDIDEVTGPRLRESLKTLVEPGAPAVTVDLSEVTFLPSAAVSVLVTVMRAAEQAGTGFDLVATAGTISHRVLTICGVPVGDPADRTEAR
jgi:anti-anti-sigma factor